MITNKGKEIISKYLLGQIPTYASHISIGCGAVPLDNNDPSPNLEDLADKVRMDFEMARVPITSKGFVDDNGVTKVSFTAELPKENRFEITEIGLWSSGSNSLAKNFDSKMVFNFSEPWQAHSNSISEIPKSSDFTLGSNGDITTSLKFFRALSNNIVFSNQDRKARNEGPRFLDDKIFLRGDSSIIQGSAESWTGENPSYSITNRLSNSGTATLTTSENHLLKIGDTIVVDIETTAFNGVHVITGRTSNTISYALSGTVATAATTGTVTWQESTHIHLNAINFDISKNAPSDKILLSFSLIDANAVGAGIDPDYVKILLEFYKNETSITSGYAKAEIQISGTEFAGDRYKVIEIPISDLITTSDFSSQQIRIARVFASVVYTTGGQQMASPIHYVELEGLRIENETTQNPVYGMVGYSIVRTPDGQPLYKYQNTNNYVEFRFNLDVG
jgi:hypothetical protein